MKTWFLNLKEYLFWLTIENKKEFEKPIMFFVYCTMAKCIWYVGWKFKSYNHSYKHVPHTHMYMLYTHKYLDSHANAHTLKAAYRSHRGGKSWKERNHTHTCQAFEWIWCVRTRIRIRMCLCVEIEKVHFSVCIGSLFTVRLYLSFVHTHTNIAVLLPLYKLRLRRRQRRWLWSRNIHDHGHDNDNEATVQQRLQLWICCDVKCACLYIPYRSRHETTKIYNKVTEWISVRETKLMDTPWGWSKKEIAPLQHRQHWKSSITKDYKIFLYKFVVFFSLFLPWIVLAYLARIPDW